jgi:metallophosphoesterase (TIGR00282 family)
MNILYIGDITGKLGRETTKELLPGLIQKHGVDLVIAQGENVSHGKGLQKNHAEELEAAGVQFFTGGNHSLYRLDALTQKDNAIRPANLPADAPGQGFRVVDTAHGKVLVVSLQGQIVGMDANKEVANPLETITGILKDHEGAALAAIIVNFHGDYSSEKIVIGQYLDGRVTAVIGDHWHVTTADAQVLPNGSAHITDVGMVGALDSSLGVETRVIVERWLDPAARVRNEMEEHGRRQFNAVLINADTATGKAKSIELIRQIVS